MNNIEFVKTEVVPTPETTDANILGYASVETTSTATPNDTILHDNDNMMMVGSSEGIYDQDAFGGKGGYVRGRRYTPELLDTLVIDSREALSIEANHHFNSLPSLHDLQRQEAAQSEIRRICFRGVVFGLSVMTVPVSLYAIATGPSVGEIVGKLFPR